MVVSELRVDRILNAAGTVLIDPVVANNAWVAKVAAILTDVNAHIPADSHPQYADTTRANAALAAHKLLPSNIHPGAGASYTPLAADYPFSKWDGGMTQGEYSVVVSSGYDGLPAGSWYVKLIRDALDTAGNKNRVYTATQMNSHFKAPPVYVARFANNIWYPFERVSEKPNVTYLSKAGHNTQYVLADGVLYSCSAQGTRYANSATGTSLNGVRMVRGVTNMTKVGIPGRVVKVVGARHAYGAAINDLGELYTWGQNTRGQCGLGHTTPVAYPTLAATGVLDAYDHPSQGNYNVNYNRLFILKADGLWVAGDNGNGQCGINNLTLSISTFTKCLGLTNTKASDIVKVFPLGCHTGSTWVLTADNRLWVAGTGAHGVHGDGLATNKLSFTDVTSSWVTGGKVLVDVKVSMGDCFASYGTAGNYSYASTVMWLTYSDGTSEIKTSGSAIAGALGNGSTTANALTPISPIGLPTTAKIVDMAAFGGSPLTVQVLYDTGELWSWGHNYYGATGTGSGIMYDPTPKLVTSAPNTTKLFSDGASTHWASWVVRSYILSDGVLKGCGYGYLGNSGTAKIEGAIGTASKTPTFVPVELPFDDHDVVDMGWYTTMNSLGPTIALTSKGNMYAWSDGWDMGMYETFSSGAGVSVITPPTPVDLPAAHK